MFYGIWDFSTNNWVKELPSKVDDGGKAILVFTNKRHAQKRAAQHFGFDTYGEAKKNGWCIVHTLVYT